MIDGEVLFALAYRDPVTRLIRPPLFLTEGATIKLKLVNKTRKPRRFAHHGLRGRQVPGGRAGRHAQRSLHRAAPREATSITRTTEGAVGRVAGLYGALVVMPVNGRTAAGTRTPYTNPTPAQCALFDALGTTHRGSRASRGGRNFPSAPSVWMFSEIDPEAEPAVERNVATGWTTLHPRSSRATSRSTASAAMTPRTTSTCCPEGYEGEPVLIRTMNAGIVHARSAHPRQPRLLHCPKSIRRR